MGIFDKIFGSKERSEEVDEVVSSKFHYKRYIYAWTDSYMEDVKDPIYSMVRIYKSNPSRFEVREIFKESPFIVDESITGRSIYLIKDLKEGLKAILQIDRWRKPVYHYKISFLDGEDHFEDEEAKTGIEDMSWVSYQELQYILNFVASPDRKKVFDLGYSDKLSRHRKRKRFCDIYK